MLSVLIILKSLHHCIGRRLEKIAKKYGVTGVQVMVLNFLMENQGKDIFQKDVERFLGIRSSTTTEILQNMTQKGLIKRTSLPNDARRKKLELCEPSTQMMQEFKDELDALREIIEMDITEEEKQTFRDVVEKVKNNLQEDENLKGNETYV
jgi:DNA-binding MarR family transcriptional regulator